MCLIPKESAKIADKDIIVYKVLFKCSNGTLRSPYKDVPYETGKLYIANIRYRECLIHKVNEYPVTTTTIEEGLHAYTLKDFAFLRAFSIIGVVFKAIIPRGAMYVLGIGNEIASTQLKLIEECH